MESIQNIKDETNLEIGIASRFEKQKIPMNQMIFWIIQYVGRIEEWSKNMLSNTNS